MEPGQTIVVVSPHSDDGVLSLGAAMATWARTGRRVELLTVLALDPSSTTPTTGWDLRAGFATEGEAARRRREEDRAACSLLDVEPAWLPFGSVDFDRHGGDDDVVEAVTAAVAAADTVLVPGFPLTHPDHAWLASLLRSGLPHAAVALYAEQPYTLRDGSAPFDPVETDLRSRVAKWRAIRRYATQLPLLGMRRSLVRSPLRLAWAAERVAWPRI